MTLLLCIGTLLGACAWRNPPLASLPPPQPDNPPNRVGEILASAHALQQTYGRYYLQSAQAEQIGQLPLIGLGSAAAFILFKGKPSAASEAGRIGIAAGTYSAARGVLGGQELPDIYIKGHAALSCVISEGVLFSGASATLRHEKLKGLLTQLATTISDLDVALNRQIVPAVTSTTDQAAIDQWRQIAADTIQKARETETASLIESTSFDGASIIFSGAYSSISMRVNSKARLQPQVNYSDFLASLSPAANPPKPKESGTQGNPSTGLEGWFGEVIALTKGLRLETAKLQAETPPYGASLSRTAKCPDAI